MSAENDAESTLADEQSSPGWLRRRWRSVDEVVQTVTSLGERMDLIERMLRGTGEAVRDVSGTLTGDKIVSQISEHSELYTQVLLGLHRDMEAADKQIREQNEYIERLRIQLEATRKQVRIIALAALIVALIAAGIAVWSTI